MQCLAKPKLKNPSIAVEERFRAFACVPLDYIIVAALLLLTHPINGNNFRGLHS
jgi:hypothetical protein